MGWRKYLVLGICVPALLYFGNRIVRVASHTKVEAYKYSETSEWYNDCQSASDLLENIELPQRGRLAVMIEELEKIAVT